MNKDAKATRRQSALALCRHRWPWFAVFAGLLAIHVTAASSEIGGNLGGDSVVYYLLAKAIAGGQGYVDLYLPANPPHTKFPFMFPLLLAPFHLFMEFPLYAMHLLVAVFNCAAAVILGAFTAKRMGRTAGIAFAILFGTMPIIYLKSLHLLSEPLYMFFVFLALLAFEKWTGDDTSPEVSIKTPALIAVLGVLALFTRSAGVVLPAALFAGLWRRRKRLYIKNKAVPAALIMIVVAALLAAPWLIRNMSAAGEATDYVGQFLAKDPYNLEAGTISAVDFGKRLLQNSAYYLPAFADGAFSPSWTPNFLQSLWPLFIILVVAGLVREIIAGHCAAELFLLFSLGIVLVWPFYEARFLVPVIPLACFYLIRGATWPADKLLSPKKAAGVLAGVMALIITFQLYSLSALVKERFEEDWMPERPVKISMEDREVYWRRPIVNWSKYHYPRQWSDEKIRNMKMVFTDYIIMNHILKELTPEKSVILSRKPMLTYFYSGRKAVPLHYSSESAEQKQYLLDNNVDYIVTGLNETVLNRTFEMDKKSRVFTKVAEIEGGISRIIKVNKTALRKLR